MVTGSISVQVRPQKPLSIRIRERTLKGTLNEIRNKQIKFNRDINILALEQSLGKTHRCIEYIKGHHEDQKIIYLTNKHDKLFEVEDELEKAKILYRHWYGFSREEGCPKFDRRKRGLLQRGLNVSIICRTYNCKKGCRYQNQFRNLPNVIIAPTEYIGTHYVSNFKPDIIFIDETINRYTKLERKTTLPVRKKNTIQNQIVNDLRTGKKIDSLIRELKTVEFEEKFPSHPFNIAWYPLIYHVFEFSKTIPVVLMDATFEMSLFKYFLKTYKYLQRRFKPSIKVWYSKVENKHNSIIFVSAQ